MTTTLHHPRYRFDRWIAAGGMGEVWAATDTLLERRVAVKVLKHQYADDPVFRARFTAEARHAAALQHPHVAMVLDYGEMPDADRTPVPFLVMELVDGRPLSALLADGQALQPDVARDLVAQAADGVAAAHRLGIVHRDVKPANLLVTADGRVKVTDFGVARAVDAAPLTLTGQLVGTPHYLSPEQVEGATATTASDVYALGIVLYECLTGRRPFVADTAVATALMHVRDPLPPFPDSVPEPLQAITRRATAKDPAARFPSMDALASALRDHEPATEPLPVPTAVPTPVPTTEPPPQPTPVPTPVPPAEAPVTSAEAPANPAVEPAVAPVTAASRPRMRRLGVVFASIVAVSLVVGAVWAVVTRPDSSSAGTGTSASSTPRPAEIPVRATSYVGMPVARAVRELRRLGFEVTTRVRTNTGTGVAGHVAGIGPTGMLKPGTRLVLTAWGPLPALPSPSSAGGDGEAAQPNGSKPGHHGENGGHAGKKGPKDKGEHQDKGGGKSDKSKHGKRQR